MRNNTPTPGACVPAECRRCEGSATSQPRLRLPHSIRLMTRKRMEMPLVDPAPWSSLRLTCSPHCRRTVLGSVSRARLSRQRSHRHLQVRQLPQAAVRQPYSYSSNHHNHNPSLLRFTARKRKRPRRLVRERRLNKGRTTLARVCLAGCPACRHRKTPPALPPPGPATAEVEMGLRRSAHPEG